MEVGSEEVVGAHVTSFRLLTLRGLGSVLTRKQSSENYKNKTCVIEISDLCTSHEV